jgi:hypothetical protein
MNAPPGTDGQIPSGLVANMASFGTALRTLLAPINNASTSGTVQCGVDLVTAPPLVLQISAAPGAADQFNMVKLEEDLSKGQRIGSYALDFYNGTMLCRGARFPTEIYTRGCHWIPRLLA